MGRSLSVSRRCYNVAATIKVSVRSPVTIHSDDIYDDLITRTVDGSDAKACHELIPCCLPRCVGVQFAVVALFFQGLGLWFALVIMSGDNN